jgi:hypothetical protein
MRQVTISNNVTMSVCISLLQETTLTFQRISKTARKFYITNIVFLTELDPPPQYWMRNPRIACYADHEWQFCWEKLYLKISGDVYIFNLLKLL